MANTFRFLYYLLQDNQMIILMIIYNPPRFRRAPPRPFQVAEYFFRENGARDKCELVNKDALNQ